MAIVNDAYNPQDSYLAFADESTFGTAIADDQVFTKFEIAGPTPGFQPAKATDYAMRNRENIVGDIADIYSSSNGQPRTLSIPQFVAPSDVLAKMVYGALHSVTEAVGDPYLKTYTINANNPDFSANEGYFYTLLGEQPIAANGYKLTSMVNEQVVVTFGSEPDGRARCSVNAIGGKTYSLKADPSGTNVFSAVTVPNFHDSNARTLTVNSLDLVWYTATITINTTYAMIGHDGSGGFNNYKVQKIQLLLDANVKYDTNSDTFLNNDLVGTDVNQTTFTVGVNSAAGYFYANSADTILLSAEADRGGDGTPQMVNLSLDLVANIGTAYPSIQIVDGVDQSW